MRKREFKILITLSIGAIASLFFVIRECSYPLIWNTAVMRWLFIPLNKEKLISNIAFSYIAAYIFYIMQIYIPKQMNRKSVCHVLAPKMEEFIFKISEFSFVIEKICSQHDGGTFLDLAYLPLYYKIRVNNNTYIKRVKDINTLIEMQRRLEDSYALMLNKFVIYNLDESILELWEKIPLEYFRELIQIGKINESRKVSVGVKGIGKENADIIKQLQVLFHIKASIAFEKVDKKEMKDIYDQAANLCTLREPELSLQLGNNEKFNT